MIFQNIPGCIELDKGTLRAIDVGIEVLRGQIHHIRSENRTDEQRAHKRKSYSLHDCKEIKETSQNNARGSKKATRPEFDMHCIPTHSDSRVRVRCVWKHGEEFPERHPKVSFGVRWKSDSGPRVVCQWMGLRYGHVGTGPAYQRRTSYEPHRNEWHFLVCVSCRSTTTRSQCSALVALVSQRWCCSSYRTSSLRRYECAIV